MKSEHNNWVLRGLYIILIARLGLAWIAFAHPERSITVDSVGYLELADGIRLSGRFEATEYLESARTPGYPLFLAVVQAICGEHIGPIVLVHLLITALTAWLLYRCGKILEAERVGLAAAWLYVLNPNSLFWSLTVLTETLFALLLILSFYTFLLAYDRMRLRWFALSGLLLGMSTLVRPIGLYLIPLWALFILLVLRSSRGFIRALKFMTIFLVAALFLVLYWQTRNYVLKGSFSLSTITEVTFSRYIAADTLAEALSIDREEALDIILQTPDIMATSFHVIRQYPLSFMRVTIRGVARTALGTEAGTWMRVVFDKHYSGSGLLTALIRVDLKGIMEGLSMRVQAEEGPLGVLLLFWGVAYSIALYALVALGLVRVFRTDRPLNRWILVFLLISAVYLILIPLASGDARFRVPAAPLLALLGGLAWLPYPSLDE